MCPSTQAHTHLLGKFLHIHLKILWLQPPSPAIQLDVKNHPLASTPADAYIVDTTHRANENHRYHLPRAPVWPPWAAAWWRPCETAPARCVSARAVLGILVPRAYETTHREVKPWTGSTSSRFSVPWIFPFRFTLLLSCVKPKFTLLNLDLFYYSPPVAIRGIAVYKGYRAPRRAIIPTSR